MPVVEANAVLKLQRMDLALLERPCRGVPGSFGFLYLLDRGFESFHEPALATGIEGTISLVTRIEFGSAYLEFERNSLHQGQHNQNAPEENHSCRARTALTQEGRADASR
jgi:hypothetical protein